MKVGIRIDAGTTPHLAKIRPDTMVDIAHRSVSEAEVISAHREGADTALSGAHAFSCPYLNDLENAAKYAAWMEGFEEGKGR
jgi:hypothetical protein